MNTKANSWTSGILVSLPNRRFPTFALRTVLRRLFPPASSPLDSLQINVNADPK